MNTIELPFASQVTINWRTVLDVQLIQRFQEAVDEMDIPEDTEIVAEDAVYDAFESIFNTTVEA